MPAAAIRLTFLVAILGWTTANIRSADHLAIAAAADLQGVLPVLAKAFEAEDGAGVRITFGSSGNFFAQIQNGAPFDVFLSADVEYPRTLIANGKAEAASLRMYAVGQLVLWSRNDSGLALARGLTALTDAAVTRVAIANPAHAPYGRAAIAALDAAGITNAVRSKLVLGENASQTAQFVASGNAQAGLVPLSLALSPALASRGRYVAIAPTLHPPIVQAAVLVTASRRKPLGERFLAFLTRGSTAARLAEGGFLPPPTDMPPSRQR